jgi:hypothetical protein
LLATITSASYSQNRIVFNYDDSGNRTSREIQTVILHSSPAVNDSTNVAVESLFDITIKIYPNPTYGQLTIEIEDFEIETPLDLVVFDRNGQPLQRHIVQEPVIHLDLSQYPSATWYIVAFMLNGERRDFKIIKI